MRKLDIDLSVENGLATVEVSEPESGDYISYTQSIEHLDLLREMVGTEIVSWIELMLDENTTK